MAKRRLQCGSCGTVIKVSSRVTRPVCPRCSTAHTYIKCGRPDCGTLMCLPENSFGRAGDASNCFAAWAAPLNLHCGLGSQPGCEEPIQRCATQWAVTFEPY
eukprot:1183565-Rhodomonas_salina.1